MSEESRDLDRGLRREPLAARSARALAKVNEILLSALTPDDVLARLVGEASEAAGAEKCLVVEVAGGRYTITHVRNVADDLVGVPKDSSFFPTFALTAEKKRPILVGDLWNDPRANRDFVVPYGLRAFQLMPLVVDAEAVGVLAFAYGRPRRFGPQNLEFSERMSTAMSLALKNARLHEAQRTELARTTLLKEIAGIGASTLDLGELATRVLDTVHHLLGATTGDLFVVDEQARVMRSVANFGIPKKALAAYREVPLDGETANARVALTGSIATHDSGDIPDSARRVEKATRSTPGRWIILPVKVRGRILGTLGLSFEEARPFEEAEVSLFESLADQLGVAIEKTRLFEAERRTTERLTDILASMTDGFVSVDREWRYTLVNPKAEQMLGVTAPEVLGKSMKELFPDMFGWPKYRKVMKSRKAETFEVWSKPLETWLEVHAYPAAEGISILFADIARRKAAETAAEQRSELLEAINAILDAALRTETVEQLGEACLSVAEQMTESEFGFIGELNGAGTFNDFAISNPGRPACKVHDRTGHRRPPSESAIDGVYGRVLRDARGFFTNDLAHHPDSVGCPEGHPPLHAFVGVPLMRGLELFGMIAVANRPGGYTETDLDTLEALAPSIVEAILRKRAEEDLSGERQRLEAHMENSPVAVVEFDSAFRVIRWSDEAERVFGWKAAEVLGKATGDFRWVYEEDNPKVDEESDRLSAGTGRSLNVNRNYRKDGSVIWCEWYDSAIYDADGTIVSVLSQILDITERKEAEARREAYLSNLVKLLGVSSEVLAAGSVVEMLQRVADAARELIGAHLVVSGHGYRDGAFEVGVTSNAGEVPACPKGELFTIERGGTYMSLIEDAPSVRLTDGELRAHPKWKGLPAEHAPLRGLLGACIANSEGDAVGLIMLSDKIAGDFTEQDELLLRQLASIASLGAQELLAKGVVASERDRLRQIIDDVPVGLMLLDPDGSVRETNRASQIIYGGELPKSRGIAEYAAYRGFHYGTGEPMRPDEWPAARVVATGEPAQELIELARLDETIAFVRIAATPLRDSSGQVIGIVVVVEEVTRELERQRLTEALNQIATTISASLNVDEILRRLIVLGNEALQADFALVSLREGGRWVIHETHGLPKETIGSTYTDAEGRAFTLAAAEGKPVLIGDALADERFDREATAVPKARAFVTLPLITQGRLLGSLSFAWRSEPQQFSEAQADFATRLMSVVSLALDNANLYERERTIADTLQEAIIAPPAPISGIAAAYVYRPASTTSQVGGDFYDVFEFAEGVAGIVVGDVSGKGLEAARLTSMLRDGIRAYSYEGTDPALILERVNSFVFRSSPVDAFATVFFGVLNVETGQLDYCSGGHPPAVLGTPGGAHLLDASRGPIVGAFDNATFPSARTFLHPDDALVLYTDGLIEARVGKELFGEERVVEAVSELRETSFAELPQRLVERALEFSAGNLRDDTVVVAVRLAD